MDHTGYAPDVVPDLSMWVEDSRQHGWGRHSEADWNRLHDLALRGCTSSATLPHDLIYKLHGWTGQLAEQPPARVAPSIAQAAKRLYDELQLYVGEKK